MCMCFGDLGGGEIVRSWRLGVVEEICLRFWDFVFLLKLWGILLGIYVGNGYGDNLLLGCVYIGI